MILDDDRSVTMTTVSGTPTSLPESPRMLVDDYEDDCPELRSPGNVHRLGMPSPQNETDTGAVVFGTVGVATPTIAFSTSFVFGILALVAFYRIRDRKRGVIFYRLLSALLWTDLISVVAIGSGPVATAVTGSWLLKELPLFCDCHSAAMLFNWYVASFLLALMSLERYLATRRPVAYGVKMERRKVKWMVGISWVLAVFVAILPAVGFGNNVIHFPGTWCFFNWFSRDTSQRLYASLFVAVVLGVMIGVTGSTASVGITIRIRHRGRRNSVTEMKPERRKGKGDGKAAVEMVLLLTGFISVFIACWTPLIMKIWSTPSKRMCNETIQWN
ncbi:prostaglandin F2-alpha receptor-like [Ptychodera flava]|uniref:prostaglandin F2-alpha receptor-like n=1 Tax=Ptychodera flava TaxID=63121 RepID=UPI00396AA247